MNLSSRIRWIAIGLTVVLIASIGALHRRGQGLALGPLGKPLPKLWPVPAFSYQDHTGRPVTERALSGHLSIVDFIYTTCTNVCPMLTARMVLLERRITDPSLRFVSFSVDPEHDTPQALAAYRARWRADPRWVLVRPDATFDRFARGMQVASERQADPNNPILHTSTFFLVDAQGMVRGVYDSIDDAELDRLTRDASRLGSSAELAPGAADGRATFGALGCAGCHDQDRIAPPLAGIAGRRVQIAQGGNIVADAVYVRRSIVDPGAQVVAGYQPLMPSYRAQLDGEQLDALVAYVMGLAAHGGASAGPASGVAVGTVVTDPICGMPVRVTATTPSATRDGRMVFFCSERCRDEFLHRGQR